MPANRDEQTLCGYHAVTAALEHRRDNLRRFFCSAERSKEFPNTMRYLASQHRIYRVLPDNELETICGSTAHQGVIAVFDKPKTRILTPELIKEWTEKPTFIMVLDNIENPHNLGAIARSAAFFGAKALLVASKTPGTIFSTAAYRVAEGAMESLELVESPNLAADLEQLNKAGMLTLGLDMRGSGELASYQGRALMQGVALAVGAEETGLTADVRRKVRLTKISGNFQAVESLNASVAAAVGMSWLMARD